ncbi:isocitrate dehydrogenase (NADP(+)) [bacterium]|nr:isocitrate dehydrogenase (NADP(+)) [bacterium]MBU4361900.1 isocitrate dehydrogenase (NADP(+)) [bacterium]MBU4602589.1 isocitrate dehydrogenase (NADP(+)) [bacterium]
MSEKIIIPFIEGDGIGPDIWRASKMVFDATVEKIYKGKRKVEWKEIYAGEKCYKKYGKWLIEETFKEIQKYGLAIKGPLTTPIGGGFRSLNVTIRQQLDLYACVRPVRHFSGVPAPVKNPEFVDVVIFRENTDDIYLGIEWEAYSKEATKIIGFLSKEFKISVNEDSGIGIKPMSEFKSKRLIRKAIKYAIENNKPNVTLVHKGNIMKYTEGAFKKWGYEVAQKEFRDKIVTEDEVYTTYKGKVPLNKIIIKDRITDAMFQQILLRPKEYSVIAAPNLNGDYLSDAILAQVGGLGLGPGANIGDNIAVFEATHGTAPKYTGMDKVNPGALILSGSMMFDYLGWTEASRNIVHALEKTISSKVVTYDLARQIKGVTPVKCSEFAKEIIRNMEN